MSCFPGIYKCGIGNCVQKGLNFRKTFATFSVLRGFNRRIVTRPDCNGVTQNTPMKPSTQNAIVPRPLDCLVWFWDRRIWPSLPRWQQAKYRTLPSAQLNFTQGFLPEPCTRTYARMNFIGYTAIKIFGI